ncbi:Uncharacterized conserved protein, DUF2147 family [Hymenobacter daecheongensis DSM 21074]|uniref:Uncharacterized conserved protein, DUF2147 family n=1 Tax=Hymenobacter daecheongensis DSM 21074 TaxID=1121955 RepID=A0A1M6LB19_9BACT|nr:DUF2147 domain-containing protein [Hymenobacter daecheongensis]SHJ68354.1 Uncharacterized conserved protein, DUF2147 family [Hymenobacter daecheongensis DSM 21074]
MNYLKSLVLVLLLLGAMAMRAPAPNPDAVLGVWKNGEGTGMVQIFKRGDKYFGRIVWLKVPNNPDGTPRTDANNPEEKLRKQPLRGLENMRDFTYSGENKWEAGKIYDPKNGSDYSCEMTLVDDNTLEVRGFIGVSLFGRTDVWKRQVKKAPATK